MPAVAPPAGEDQVPDAVDGRADIYSLGATAYYLTTGRPPFEGRSVTELIRAHQSSPPIPPSQVITMRDDFEAVILRCLAKAPSDRFREVEDLRSAIRACHDFAQWNESKSRDWWLSQNHHGSPLSNRDGNSAAPTQSRQLLTEPTRAL